MKQKDVKNAHRIIHQLRAEGYQIKTTTTASKGELVTAYRLTRKTPVKNYATLNLAA